MGDKSYWFEGEQKGNYSNNKKDTFDPGKGYIGIRLQQGVPLLDRDWNELEDIRRYNEQMLRKLYIGNGPLGDAFKIKALNPNANDFYISQGRCLVNGLEAVNEENCDSFVDLYSSQNDVDPKILNTVSSGSRIDTVYLDVWIEEIAEQDEGRLSEQEKEKLGNKNDVKMWTCTRHKVEWRVRIEQGKDSAPPANSGHNHLELARITRTGSVISENEIVDLRSTIRSTIDQVEWLKWMINALLRGEFPADNQEQLTTLESPYKSNLIEDSKGLLHIFYKPTKGECPILYKYSDINQPTKWSRDFSIADESVINFKVIDDYEGNIWIFWISEGWIHFGFFKSGSLGYKIKDNLLFDTKSDNHGEFYIVKDANHEFLWIFWYQDGVLYYNKIKSGKFIFKPHKVVNADLTKGTINSFLVNKSSKIYLLRCDKGLKYDVYDPAKDIVESSEVISSQANVNHCKPIIDKYENSYIFWISDSDIWVRYLDQKRDLKIISTASPGKDYWLFEKENGDIWLIFSQLSASSESNYWCKRFIDGMDWLNDMRLTGSRKNRYFVNAIDDHMGNAWIYWLEYKILLNQVAKVVLMRKRCYDSI